MLESITFKRPKDMDAERYLAETVSHICLLPSIAGKTFSFKKGLNVIVGPNGSGKTSLLSAIRQLWLAETDDMIEPCSYNPFWQFFNLSFMNHFNEGLYEFCDMKADFSKPLFCLRKDKDIRNENVFNSAMNMLQFMTGKSLSNGESVTNAVAGLITMMQGRHPSRKDTDYMDFGKVLDDIIDLCKKTWCCDGIWKESGDRDYKIITDCFTGFYRRNVLKPSSCLTAVLDEPDDGMDIYRLEELRKLLVAVQKIKRDQFIVVLHNVALIRNLHGVRGVNFIELSEGYLDAVLSFGKRGTKMSPPSEDAAKALEKEGEAFVHRLEEVNDRRDDERAKRAEEERRKKMETIDKRNQDSTWGLPNNVNGCYPIHVNDYDFKYPPNTFDEIGSEPWKRST